MARCETPVRFLVCATQPGSGRARSDTMESAVRHRLLLSLRSEQALGLRAIPRGTIEMPVEILAAPESAPVAPPRVALPQAAPRSARPELAMLYGQPRTPPAKPV